MYERCVCQNLYAAPTYTTNGFERSLSNIGSYLRPAEMFQRWATLKSKPGADTHADRPVLDVIGHDTYLREYAPPVGDLDT